MTGTRRLELAIAWRYLRSRRRSRLLSFLSAIAVAGVVVGVSALLLIMGVMNGLQTDLREKILTGSPDVRVLTYGDGLRMDDWRAAAARVDSLPGVVAVAPFVIHQGLATTTSTYTEAVTVAGIAPGDSGSSQVTTIRDHARTGDFLFRGAQGAGRGAVVGALLAERLGAYPGTTISLVTASGGALNPVLGGLVPSFATFEVTGVFETGMYVYDNGYVFVDLPAAQAFAGLDTAVTGLEVRTTDRWAAPAVASTIDSVLGYPYRTVDWRQQNQDLFKALSLEKLGMGIVLTLIIMVAAFNIVSTLTMVVRDKAREIGILRAMGLRADAIRRIFLLQGLFIGGVGTAGGVLLGVGLGWTVDTYRLIPLEAKVYFIDHLPIRLAAGDVLLVVAVSVLVSVLATLHPARAAARLMPVEAIRGV
ncbi:MAG: ABC transporter permease [Gemmatimonadota bacterium]|nr:ABC transporter permease [Gemmatimonadota bacterium]MDQ8146437.1 ABC transporter permease [Gemmatimonadota bacterium]MDQ8148364.1 ABC transporter permease [Gemmatimonadota bacterium]MDQ8156170.1 ABC transporter permease [Gemmatimonadota bacterium]MDQ8176155.1 ABC transporter permease [Gemmatimonadota bacterium]